MANRVGEFELERGAFRVTDRATSGYHLCDNIALRPHECKRDRKMIECLLIFKPELSMSHSEDRKYGQNAVASIQVRLESSSFNIQIGRLQIARIQSKPNCVHNRN